MNSRTTLPNPFYGNVFFDSCAFDGGNEEEQAASNEARTLFENKGGNILILHSVQKEIEFPNTPQSVKDEAENLIYTIEPSQCTPNEIKEFNVVKTILVGDGNPENKMADCVHVFHAQRNGGRYFVTTDNGILNHSTKIIRRFNLYIVKPSDFLRIVEDNKSRNNV